MPRKIPVLLSCAFLGCGPVDAPGDAVPDDAQADVPARAATAPDDRRARVVFLGTSLTAGLGLLRDEETYVARVAELADSAGVPIEAVNAGVSGETSAGGMRRLDWVLREPLDILVLELGANDGLRGQDPRALGANLRAIVDRTRARYPTVDVVIAGMEAPPNLGSVYVELFGSIFRQVADETGSSLVPFLLAGVAGVPGLNQPDGIHPTPEGHRLMAANVWPVLEPLLRARVDVEPADSR